MKTKKGFTIIELLLVIAILGIISAIAIPKFWEIKKKAKLDADIETSRAIISAAKIELLLDNKIANSNISSDPTTKITLSNEKNLKYMDELPVIQSEFKGASKTSPIIIHYNRYPNEFVVYFYTLDGMYEVTSETYSLLYDKTNLTKKTNSKS
jgi:prepilin-type N-terminal cleavage/methylation domain-containing protein